MIFNDKLQLLRAEAMSDEGLRGSNELAPAPHERTESTLVNRNVFVGRRRTSLRLEPAMWDALAEICRREDLNLHELCALIDERRRASSLTAAIRVFVVNYFRSAATEEGHASMGHGALYKAQRRRASVGEDAPLETA